MILLSLIPWEGKMENRIDDESRRAVAQTVISQPQ
jgi:hypothetical protein